MTSYAAEICLKRSSSPALESGWCLRASFRYALVMSLSDASGETPKAA